MILFSRFIGFKASLFFERKVVFFGWRGGGGGCLLLREVRIKQMSLLSANSIVMDDWCHLDDL